MRKIRVIVPLLIVTSFSSAAHTRKQNPKGDWNAVKSLAIGTPLSVLSPNSHHLLCYFERTTDDELYCEPLWPGIPSSPWPWPWPWPSPWPVPYPHPYPPGPAEYVFKRAMVQEVREEHTEATNRLIGMGIGGGIGAAVGAARWSDTPAGGALLVGLVGSTIGGLIGRAHPLFHGHVIYKQ